KTRVLSTHVPTCPIAVSYPIASACLRAGQHDLAVTCFYARSDIVSALFIRAGGSLKAIVKMFTYVLQTFAHCVSCWRGDQQGGHYDNAEHKGQPALRYRHFSLPQSSSASRFAAGASAFLILSQSGERPER